MNTEVSYLYRDGSNYKQYGRVVLAGEITDAERKTITDALDQGEYLIAEQVGLPNLREEWSSHYEDDHIWHEISDGALEHDGSVRLTDAKPTGDEEDVHAFAARFVDITWDEDAANKRLTGWVDATPIGK